MLAFKTHIHQAIDRLIKDNDVTDVGATFIRYQALLDVFFSYQAKPFDLEGYFEDNEVKTYAAKLRHFMLRWECYLEGFMYRYMQLGEVPHGIESSVCEMIKDFYVSQYRALVCAEIKAAAIDRLSKVCHVGIGAMPLSILMLHKYTHQCAIVGIDKDHEALRLATLYLKQKSAAEPLHYDPCVINLTVAEGAAFSYHGFDTVILSTSITNKEAIVSQILKTASRDIILLDRQVKGLFQYWYQGSAVRIDQALLRSSTRASLVTLDTYALPIHRGRLC